MSIFNYFGRSLSLCLIKYRFKRMLPQVTEVRYKFTVLLLTWPIEQWIITPFLWLKKIYFEGAVIDTRVTQEKFTARPPDSVYSHMGFDKWNSYNHHYSTKKLPLLQRIPSCCLLHSFGIRVTINSYHAWDGSLVPRTQFPELLIRTLLATPA